MNREEEFEQLEANIKKAQEENKSIEPFVLREIEMLKETLQIVENKYAKNPNLEQFTLQEIQIRQYGLMRNLAKKINKPTTEYENKIKEIQISIVGEENWEIIYAHQFDE